MIITTGAASAEGLKGLQCGAVTSASLFVSLPHLSRLFLPLFLGLDPCTFFGNLSLGLDGCFHQRYEYVPTICPAVDEYSRRTVDDSSSLILYDPPSAWTSPSGNDAQAYMNSTFHGTSVSGATAKLTFTGTGVWLYGARQPHYGSFILVVDNEVSAYSNATASKAATGQLLGAVQNLELGQHVVTIMNGGSGPIDLDAIVYETVGQTQQGAPPQASGDPTSFNGASQTSSSSASTQSGKVSAKPHAITGSGNGDSSADTSSAPLTAVPIIASPDAPPPTTQVDTGAQNTGAPGTPNVGATPVPASPNALPSGSSQAERARDPTVTGTSQLKGGLPKSAVIGIIVGCAVAILLIAALLFMFLRRRRRARNGRRKTLLPSPILPLQDPEKESGYFFGGHGGTADTRGQYVEQSPQWRMSQTSSNTAATLGVYAPPPNGKDTKEMPTPPAPIFVRDSSYTSETATLNGDDDGYDIADLYSHMVSLTRSLRASFESHLCRALQDPGAPIRPPRPPELRLSV
ncbi:hypothetical protein TRAPUB_3365 [Trametes pubescens]|uniref:Uncharacterized protein n=1 Tax=Trametes pubescens TaxID=154538 RepID=A0A1M2VE12_TRAPU|nr:hypothetical protein TRAPUB_3365 [Trametes pubescens]